LFFLFSSLLFSVLTKRKVTKEKSSDFAFALLRAPLVKLTELASAAFSKAFNVGRNRLTFI